MIQKKLLVTGCSGFIAEHLIKEAQAGKWFVVGVDKRPIPKNHAMPDHFIQADVKDLNARDLIGIDAVVHFAWRTNIADCLRYPRESTEDNINMSVHLMEICKEANIKKFIFPTTASLYSHNPTPWNEEMNVDPIEFYSWQKLSVERLCQMYSKCFNLPTVILRFFQVYGEFQREDTAISVFQKLKSEGKPVTLTETKNPEECKSGQRDFIYAGDIANAVMKSIKSSNVGNGEIINICTGKLTSIEKIAETMKARIKWIPTRPFDVDVHLGNPTKARVLLNWEPKVDVIDWLIKNNI